MNLLKCKSKRLLLVIGAFLMALFTLAVGLGLSNRTAYADNTEMTDLPKATNSKGNKYSGNYGFSADVVSGITKVKPFGGTSGDWSTSKTNTEDNPHHWYAFQLSYGNGKDAATNNNKWKGKVGVYYSNVGIYNGHTVDIKITLMDWKVKNYRWEDIAGDGKLKRIEMDTAYAAFGKDDFEIFTPGMGALKYRMDYIDHDTHKAMKLTAKWNFDDIDGNQWVGIEPSTMSSVDQIFYGDPSNGNTWLSPKKAYGEQYIYSDANQHHTAVTKNGRNEGTLTSKDKKGSFTATYSNASSFIINWVYGQNTGKHAVEEQNTLEKDSSYWTMVGKYDPDADTQYPISNIDTFVTPQFFNHAYLKYGTNAIVPDKPKNPQKFVSDSDEGTDVPVEIGTDKSVDHDLLKNRYEMYHYELTHDVPAVRKEFKYTQYMITDSLDKILDISNVHVYNRENQDVTYMFTASVNSANKLSVIAKDSTLASDDFYRETYKVTFDAKVKPGVSLASHADPKHKDQAVIYNSAKVTTSNGSADSNKTTTNIPFTPKNQKKTVSVDGNGDGDSLKVDFDQEYKYRVDVAAPDGENLKSIELKDKLEDVLNLKDVKVYDVDDGNKDVTSQGKLTTDNNTADWVANDASKWHGKHFRFIVTASVKNTPDLMKYLDEATHVIKIPNKASWIINSKDDPTNKVIVEPKSPVAAVDKWIEVQE